MRIIGVFLIVLGLVSCKEPEVKKVVFDSIEFTYSNGWTRITSLNLDSDKVLTIFVDDLKSGVHYYREIVNDSLANKVDSIAEIVLKEKHDSIINQPVLDGASYYFIATVNATQFATRVYSNGEDVRPMDDLVHLLLSVAENSRSEVKGPVFEFKSYKKMALPAIDTNVVFVPPVIKDDEIEK